ncbi:MAG: glycerol-3-phosphate dehydrogenase [Clostridiales bacterium]|nr:glycerol-3-phosphate dehydrogenase [Clostridiales bacterium]
MSVITIIGAGMMGSAMCFPASDNAHEVRLVGTPLDREIIDAAGATGRHIKLNMNLPEGVKYYQTEQTDEALDGADLLIGGVSSFGVDWFGENILPKIPEALPVLSVTKGLRALEDGTLEPFPHYLMRCYSNGRRLSLNAIGGPCTSYELAAGHQTHVAFCGENYETLVKLRGMLSTGYYHITASTDVRGVECAVAMKNAYALGVTLAVGLSEKIRGEGMADDYNAQAALFGQSVYEMGRVLELVGADSGNIIFGAGDLYVTIFGGRTRKIGTLLGRGMTYTEAARQLEGITLESVVIARESVKAIKILSQNGKADINDFPLLMHIGELINDGKTANVPWESFTHDRK